jgi:predicted ribosome quality control (RQC) complex YloA/Tae2 family protein
LIPYPSISMAIEENLFDKGTPPTKQEMDLLTSKERMERMIENQTKALKERQVEIESNQLLADSLFLDYVRIDGLLKSFDPKRFILDRKEYPDVLAFKPNPDGKGGYITIMIETSDGGKNIDLDITKDITHNAEMFYDKVKKARSKVPGIERAIEDARTKMKRIVSTPVEERPQVPLRRFWFEDFRWCFSSEGVLMIGGRDARSNERLVKKYLRDKDIYAHADIKGAPSVIVRVEKSDSPTDITMEEACHLSILHSKAWISKLGAESGFWVRYDQVSRTPESGEFLPKGSFMIRGKKNMVLKLPLEGAVGLLYVEGVPKVMFGPVSAVRKNCKGTIFRIVPGKMGKNDVAKMMARELGAELDQVLSSLPPGDMDASRMG